MKRLRLALVFLVASASLSHGNGRFPGSTNLSSFEDTILLSTTFGLLISQDHGESFQWICEEAIEYGGEYDPDYAVHPVTHDIWATTFEALRFSKDGGCTWSSVGPPLDKIEIAEVEIGSDQRIWVATSDQSKANDVFTSLDGVTFTSAGLPSRTTRWTSLKVAPSDPMRVYLSGSQAAPAPAANLRKTLNGGETWVEMSLQNIAFGIDFQASIVGISPTDPNLVFLRVINAKSPIGDTLYRSENAGESWAKVLEFDSTITGFVILSDGVTVLVGSNQICPGESLDQLKGCTYRSTDSGKTFVSAPSQPKSGVTPTPSTSNCLEEASDGTLLTCGANWEPDLYTLGRSTDQGTSWQKVIRFGDVEGPLLNCPEASAQSDCAKLRWPTVCQQIGKCPPPKFDGGLVADDASVSPNPNPGKKGCGCETTSPGEFTLLAGCLLVLFFRRRTAKTARALF